MGDDRKSAVSHAFRDGRAVKGYAFMYIDEAQAIGAAQHDAGARAKGLQLALPCAPLIAEFSEPACEHHRGSKTVCDTFLKCRHDLVGRQREHRALRGFGQLSKGMV